MEYLYIAMFLQEIGKEINEANIQKIFNSLNVEFDIDKVRLLIPALSILATSNQKKSKIATEFCSFQQLNGLQKQFEVIKDSIIKADDRLLNPKETQLVTREDSSENEGAKVVAEKEIDQPEKIVKTEPSQSNECDETDTKNEVVYPDENSHELPARYVYGIADKGIRENLGAIGINGTEVYTIPYKDMCIVVHDCQAEPYQSDDEEVVKNWLFTQQEVLDVVGEKYGVVLPMSFDMIIEGKAGSDPEQEVKDWLEKNYDDFYEKIARLRNKQEFVVQVFLDTEALSEKLIETDEELRTKKKEIDAKPKGVAYIERELLKDMVKEKIEGKSDQYFKEFYTIIKNCTDDIVIGKTKKAGGNKQMIMNLSCLVNKDRVGELGEELEKIEKEDGVSVRFSGPWAPFSFVTPDKG